MDYPVRCWLLLGIAGALVGCNQSHRPATVPVSGTITVDGKPVEGAQVTFMAEGAARAAIGNTDAQGRYRLTTFEENDGAIVGTHKVTVAMAAPTDTSEMSAEDPSAAYGQAMMGAAAGKPAESGGIPSEYSNPATSKLTAEVEQGGENKFDFDLSTESRGP